MDLYSHVTQKTWSEQCFPISSGVCFLSIQSPFLNISRIFDDALIEFLTMHVAAQIKTYTSQCPSQLAGALRLFWPVGLGEVGSFQVLPVTEWVCPPLFFFPYLMAKMWVWWWAILDYMKDSSTPGMVKQQEKRSGPWILHVIPPLTFISREINQSVDLCLTQSNLYSK